MKITCKLKGGLGNNLFQIAATLSTALESGCDWNFNGVELYDENYSPHHPGQFIKDIFPNIDHFYTRSPFEFSESTWKIYKEPKFSYSAIPVADNEKLCLDGYFQSERYFRRYDVQIRYLFAIPYTQNKGTVSIHVRRGNYLSPEKQDYHPFVGEEYLYNAVVYFHLKGFNKFLVFSDDIPWCRQYFEKIKSPGMQFFYSEGHTDVADLVSMCHCEHHIIANSSFSWWGAWLNQNPNKIVVAPKRWFGPAGPTDTQDLLPEEWITL